MPQTPPQDPQALQGTIHREPSVNIETVVDARALRCPMPLLKLKQALHGVEAGQVVELLATDAGSWRDIPVYASLAGHEIVLQEQVDGEFHYRIRRGE